MGDLHINPNIAGTHCSSYSYSSGEQNPPSFVQVDCYVSDPEVRAVAPGFDGLERPFVNAPYGGIFAPVTWEELPLNYTGTTAGIDHYSLTLGMYGGPEVDMNAIGHAGLSFGMNINTGDAVWLNGDNQFPLGRN
jgi:hypothetical protein